MQLIPNLLKKEPIPKEIPKELSSKIAELSSIKDQEQFLKEAFLYVAKRWHGPRYKLVTESYKLFTTDIYKIMHTKGYQHCTNMNFILRTILIKGKRFKESDIELKITQSWFLAPHQYLRMKLSKEKHLDVDPWNYQFGIEFGDYGKGVKSKHIFPIR